MDIIQLLNELEGELCDKRGIFSKKIDIDHCAQIVGELKQAIPESIAQANAVLSKKTEILKNADIVSSNMIREAEEHAAHIIENSELAKRAEIEANMLIETAGMQCDTLVERTKSHLDNMFKEIEQFLLSTLAMVRNNREELRGAMIINPRKKK